MLVHELDIRRSLIQRLESLQRAGVTHLPRPSEARAVRASADELARPAGPTVVDTPVEKKSSPTSAVAPPDWSPRMETAKVEPAAVSAAEARAHKAASDSPESRQASLDELAKQVARCVRCSELAATRTQTVFGVGNPGTRLVFLGEAPGRDEDEQGIPFVGRAGKLLTDIIERGMGLRREEVYICNILRCRPPNNRTPLPVEAGHCRQWLDATLAIIRPEFICCLGAVAATNLLGTEETIGKLRGRWFESHGARVMCTYHPAYLLRNPEAKGKTWEDIQMLMRAMGLAVPPRG